jgi:poly-gamma-glutamate capsule biosynthesis protein CapA/YwtB (metallophosphatase superfamily)
MRTLWIGCLLAALTVLAAAHAQERVITDPRTGLRITITADPTLPEGMNTVIRLENYNGPMPNQDGSNINAPPLNVNVSAFERSNINVNATP